MKTDLPEVVSSEEFAELVDLTPRHLRNLASAGAVTFAGRGKIALKSSIKGLLEHAKRSADRDAEAASRAALNDIRVRREAAKLAILDGQFMPVEDATAILVEAIGAVRHAFDVMPARIAGTDWTLRRKIEIARDEALQRASDKLAQLSKTGTRK